MRIDMYTKDDYKADMEKLISDNEYDPILVAKTSYRIYMDNALRINKNIRGILLDVATMESGPEFEMTETEFREFLSEI